MPMKKNRRPTMRPMPEEGSATRAMEEVMPRPMMRPRDKAEEFMSGQAIERGNRASQREAKKFAKGGKVNGFPDLNKDGKVTKADVLKGRGVEGFAAGGEVRGCKAGQMSGKGFSGNY